MPPTHVSRFERHPALTLSSLLVLLLLLVEVGLRVAGPSALRFVYAARQVHAVSSRWVVDLVPRRCAHLGLVDRCGDWLFNFLLTTGDDGFRIPDRPRDQPPLRQAAEGLRYVHAIGDSYTMGWGVDYTSSYPAQLEALLPPDWRVLNLGVDGFGTKAATEKSLALADQYPPAHAIYLFCANDPDDDARAERAASRPRLAQLGLAGYDVLRRHTYVANLPFALRWARVSRGGSCPADRPEQRLAEDAVDVKDWILPASDETAADPPGLSYLTRYAEFLVGRHARLTVLAIDDEPASRALVAACRRRGITAALVAPPASVRLRGDGHLTLIGNAALARHLRGYVLAADGARSAKP